MKRVSKLKQQIVVPSLALTMLLVPCLAYANNADALLNFGNQLNTHGLTTDRKLVYHNPQTLNYAQVSPRNSPTSAGALRSKSEVMQEVKARYNAKVVKIILNERSATYSVRVLLPSGKIKNLSISAKK